MYHDIMSTTLLGGAGSGSTATTSLCLANFCDNFEQFWGLITSTIFFQNKIENVDTWIILGKIKSVWLLQPDRP